MPYELAVEELTVKFRHMMKEYQDMGMYSPIEQVKGRVKRSSSIIDKAYRKNIPLATCKLEEAMDDIAGIRIICQFVDDIKEVVEIIRGRSDMKVIREQDYITNRKRSGYRSYHITIEYEVETIHGRMRLPVEIQIRTLAMNFWAVIEHSLQYKYQGELPEHIHERILKAADAVLSLDEEMSSIRDEVMDAQHIFQDKANMVENILHILEKIHNLMTEEEYQRIYNKFFQIYKTGDMLELADFNANISQLDELLQQRKTKQDEEKKIGEKRTAGEKKIEEKKTEEKKAEEKTMERESQDAASRNI